MPLCDIDVFSAAPRNNIDIPLLSTVGYLTHTVLICVPISLQSHKKTINQLINEVNNLIIG